MYKSKFKRPEKSSHDYNPVRKIKSDNSININGTKYKKIEPKTEHRQQITHDELIKLGFNYRMKFYTKNGFTIQFYKYIWKYGYRMTHEGELIYLDDLKAKYLEIIGEPI